MSDPRIGDSVRQLIPMFIKQEQELIDLKADNQYIKGLLREIKAAVIRKGKKDES